MLPGLATLEPALTACVLDAARLDGLPNVLAELEPRATSLYSGPAGQELADVAPWLAPCKPGSPLNHWLLETVWGGSGGILIQSQAGLDALRQHFRRCLRVIDESGKTLYFRFYDPRVLRVFLPTCDAEQLRHLFGPIDAFVVEDEDPARALVFRLAGGDLVTEPLDLRGDAAELRPVIAWKGRRR